MSGPGIPNPNGTSNTTGTSSTNGQSTAPQVNMSGGFDPGTNLNAVGTFTNSPYTQATTNPYQGASGNFGAIPNPFGQQSQGGYMGQQSQGGYMGQQVQSGMPQPYFQQSPPGFPQMPNTQVQGQINPYAPTMQGGGTMGQQAQDYGMSGGGFNQQMQQGMQSIPQGGFGGNPYANFMQGRGPQMQGMAPQMQGQQPMQVGNMGVSSANTYGGGSYNPGQQAAYSLPSGVQQAFFGALHPPGPGPQMQGSAFANPNADNVSPNNG